MNEPRILFVGDDWLGSNARSMASGFRAAGADVLAIDTSGVNRPRRLSAAWTYSKVTKSRSPRSRQTVAKQVIEASRSFRPDILFCFKTIHLDQAQLLDTNAGIRVHYSADDVGNPYNTTTDYLRHEPEWDMVITTKSFNVSELIARGAKAASFVWSAYDPSWHFPAARSRQRQFDIGFIGNRRPDRVREIEALSKESAFNMYVAGPGWRRRPGAMGPTSRVEGAVYGEALSRAIANVYANLVMLNSENRDLHTCRSFEVPAAGGLVIAERTSEHQAMFDEGTEAYMYSSFDELLDVCTRAVSDRRAGVRMARLGYARTVSDRNTYRDRADQILRELGLRIGK